MRRFASTFSQALTIAIGDLDKDPSQSDIDGILTCLHVVPCGESTCCDVYANIAGEDRSEWAWESGHNSSLPPWISPDDLCGVPA